MMSSDIAIDFGATEMRIFIPNRGVFSEPSVVAIDNQKEEVVAMGKDAYNMLGRTGDNITFSRPFTNGKVSDLSIAEYMFTTNMKKYGLGKVFLPAVTVAVPDNITQVEKDAIYNVLERSGIKKIRYVDNVKAAFIGVGENIKSSVGIMIANIGYESGFCSIMAQNRKINSKKISVGGDQFNKAFIDYIRKIRGVLIGPQTAEYAKREIGSVSPRGRMISCHIKGRNIYTGLPADIVVTSDETIEAYVSVATKIASEIEECLEFIPPEILGDISRSGITLCGGGALLYGLDKYLHRRLKFEVKLSEKPVDVILNGLLMDNGKLQPTK